jgi:hypothetical protein
MAFLLFLFDVEAVLGFLLLFLMTLPKTKIEHFDHEKNQKTKFSNLKPPKSKIERIPGLYYSANKPTQISPFSKL